MTTESNAPPARGNEVAVSIKWHVKDGPQMIEFQSTRDLVTPREIVSSLGSLVDQVAAATVAALERAGGSVSCRRGCDACCHQLASVSDMEAHAIGAVVAAMPDDKRARLMARFEEAARVIDARFGPGALDAGVMDEDRHGLAMEYFKLRLACPFLEDSSCAIYDERPLICREYMVSSPAENCWKLGEAEVETIVYGLPAAGAQRMTGFNNDYASRRVALALLPRWLAANEPPAPRSGVDWMFAYMGGLKAMEAEIAARREKAEAEAAAEAPLAGPPEPA
ncbi:MAG: YkgJ family cysteine cluster protein [Rhodospirillales bacterium]|nr:MAG: YkgJ family cysteine cluster protein [Rhodospirillales bacterium]